MLTGGLLTHAKLLIPPGDQTVLDKIQLSGTFRIANAQVHQRAR